MTLATNQPSYVDSAAHGRRYLLLPPAGGTRGTLREILDAAPRGQIQAVAYPGRADRLAEPAPDTFDELVERVVADVADWVGATSVTRTVVVGFSMGGLVGLELVDRLSTLHSAAPAALVVVGTVAPQRRTRPRVSWLDTDALRLLMHQTALVPGAVSSMDHELLDYATAVLRDDLRLVAGYRGPAFAAAPCPIAALCGEHDRFVGAVDDATRAWQPWATGGFVADVVPGGHLDLLGTGAQFWSCLDRVEKAIVHAERIDD